MQLEKWQQIVGMVKDQFGVDEEGEDIIEDVPNSKIDFIIFQGPLGKMKLEYITKPILLDKKTIGSRRIGSETAVDYIYSEDEFSHTFKAYKLDEDSGGPASTRDGEPMRGGWIEMEAGAEAFTV